jgi:redox-sensitive bicupin YhaK (pirin superfamily)
MQAQALSSRSVQRIVPTIRTLEGGGFVVRRPFPTAALADVDPFLLLDHLGPFDAPPGEAKGAPDHPHRGFETVSYILEGDLEHRDSAGNAGHLGPGDVQWMTAGSGVVHSEMPSAKAQRNGGRVHGVQLWVNLPRRSKMTRPRYQEIPAARIPEAARDGVKVRVIAGEAYGVHAVIETHTPILYFHVSLAEGARFEERVPEGYAVMAYVLSGDVSVGRTARRATEGELAILGADGDGVTITAAAASEVLVIGGVPLREPVARHGPFVMNTTAELVQAFEDYSAGRMGTIAP